jgi:Na+/melibiose symporter-like transporter
LRERPRLTFARKFAYGVGQMAEGLKNGAFGVFVFFYYQQVLGLSGSYAGLAVGLALIIDALADPLAGSISDNWRSRLGRRHPFIYASIVPMAACFILLFSPPDFTGSEFEQFWLFLWLFTFALLTRVAMSFYHVPHTALGAELTNDFAERTTVVAYRQFFSTFGGLLTYAIGFGLFFQATPEVAHGQFRIEQYTPFAICISLVMVASVFLSAWGTQAYVPFLPQPVATSQRVSASGSIARTLREVVEALSNRSFAWLFVGVLVVFMMVGVDSVLNLHINTYFWELSSSGNLFFFAATPVGIMVGSLFARRINDRFDKKPSVVFGTSWWAFCQITPIVLRLVGWFPENGTDTLLWTLVAVKFLQGAGVAQALITFGSMIADIVDEHELSTGKRQEGVFFAASAFSGKITTGLGGVVAGFALDLISWPRGAEIRTAADVPPETLMWLGLLYGPIVSGFVVVSVWCYSKHHLNRARHAEILSELEVRRQGTARFN